MKGRCRRIGVVVALLIGLMQPLRAQAPLWLVNERTTIRAISFRFVDTQTFEEDQLRAQMVLRAPSWWDRVKRWLPFVSAPRYRFDPIELARDVVRLRRFYTRNGFLHTEITYPASQLDTTRNTIHIVLSIREGPPLLIQNVGFVDPKGRSLLRTLDEGLRERWRRFRDRIALQVGDRYTETRRVEIQDAVLNWFRDRGYAFAQVRADVRIDSVANTVDLRFVVDTGPRGYFSKIQIEGNRRVSDRVLRRELPFRVGDVFSQRKVVEGQRQLFGLEIFRVALADIPPQPRDSTVTVRYRVAESALRFLVLQGGFGRSEGLGAEVRWTHRNFLGDARTLTLHLVAQTGLLARRGPGTPPPRVFRFSALFRQPYLFSRRMELLLSPFLEYQRDPLLEDSNEPLQINTREFGLNTTLFYEIYPFRTITLQHAFSRALQLTQQRRDTTSTRDLFDKSILSVTATFGRTNNYFNPRRGYLIRPFAELGGGLIGSEVEYYRLGTELIGYLPLTRRSVLAGRLLIGRLEPLHRSRDALAGRLGRADSLRYENRFDPILFYAGGSSDVRGWGLQQLGPKITRLQVSKGDTTIYYEPIGGNRKLIINLELRFRLPGFSSDWQGAVFLDGGQLAQDQLRLRTSAFRWAAGLGLRYQTPAGFIRLDLAYKLNPSYEDLRNPADVYRYRQGLTARPPEAHWQRRFRLHLSIGQTF
ncbi:BamA/OMP85 family outer membrane protein [Rhodothermus profundi]|uniref:Beta-barrel assembly machine subunit BamA n=1 Tax=Rhodothermus profundi TaxID=633813 RepID=A0A1M6S0Y8_9BACT|nr:BamA/TamA family outer membrane protein [Rhodothermus profundi]SHK38401.1 Beta-barrel assembly machine subunit BamA [Rhodothermus profundi]